MTGNVSEEVEKVSNPSPFSALISAVAAEDMVTVDAHLSDDVQWDMMPTGQTLKGKKEVMTWLKAGSASRKEPVVISDLATKDWGTFEYWNIGTVTDELVAFGNQNKWPWPKDPKSLIGQKYKVAQCFVWHLDAAGKICLMKQYLDTGSVWAQFK
jgi:ketosteroid isomerase-like protein